MIDAKSSGAPGTIYSRVSGHYNAVVQGFPTYGPQVDPARHAFRIQTSPPKLIDVLKIYLILKLLKWILINLKFH